MPAWEVVLGLDFGTTHSCVAVWRNNSVEVIANQQGNYQSQSCVAFTAEEQLVGDAAASQAARNPSNTVTRMKRLIGRKWDDEVVQSERGLSSCKWVQSGAGAAAQVSLKGQSMEKSPEQLCTLVVAHVKEQSEMYVGGKIKDAIVTVPVNYTSVQEAAMKTIVQNAGLRVRAVVPEPVAAWAAHHYKDCALPAFSTPSDSLSLVFDLGSGSLSVSLLQSSSSTVKVLTSHVDETLGAHSFTSMMVQRAAADFKRKHKLDLSESRRSLHKLTAACEVAKCTLSLSSQASIEAESLYEGIDFSLLITRPKFEDICASLWPRLVQAVARVLKQAHVSPEGVSDVILAGGGSAMSKVKSLLQGQLPNSSFSSVVKQDESVAIGGALCGGLLGSQEPSPSLSQQAESFTSLSVGVAAGDGSMAVVVPRGSRVPGEWSIRMHGAAGQGAVINVHEGEHVKAGSNKLLATLPVAAVEGGLYPIGDLILMVAINADGTMDVSCRASQVEDEEPLVAVRVPATGRMAVEDAELVVAEAVERYELDIQTMKDLQKTAVAVDDDLDCD